MVATSTPASRSAVSATGGAWKVNSLFCAVPWPSVIAVSRLTIVRSASASPGCAWPNTVRGLRASRVATRSMKWTSPAKLIVKAPGLRGGADVRGAGPDADGATGVATELSGPGVDGAGAGAGPLDVHPATARAATMQMSVRPLICDRAVRVTALASTYRHSARTRPTAGVSLPPNASPSEPAEPVRVAAGTSALDALREAGIELTGPRGAVVVRAADGVLKDLDWAPDADVEVEPVAAGLARTGWPCCGTPPRTCMAQAVQELFPGHPARHRPAHRGRLLLRLLPSPTRSPRTTSPRSRRRCARSSRPASASPAGRRPTTTPAPSWRDEPFKLELIGLKSAAPTRPTRPTRGRRRRADHVRQPRREVRRAGLEGPVPRPAPADHPAHPGVQADAQRGRLLARRREEPAAAAHLRHRLGQPRTS